MPVQAAPAAQFGSAWIDFLRSLDCRVRVGCLIVSLFVGLGIMIEESHFQFVIESQIGVIIIKVVLMIIHVIWPVGASRKWHFRVDTGSPTH